MTSELPVNLRRHWAADLGMPTLYALLRLRAEVFVAEQNCAYVDLDGLDLLPQTRHFWLEQDGHIVAALRLLEEKIDGARGFRIGRVVTASQARGRGYSTRLMRAALADIGTAPCVLSAQAQVAEMYTRFGFAVSGPRFLDDGIVHVPMSRGLQ